jgi:hypothetical protein
MTKTAVAPTEIVRPSRTATTRNLPAKKLVVETSVDACPPGYQKVKLLG